MKKKFEITSSLENFVKGLVVCLISLCLLLNVGYVARTFAFPFIYTFGTGAFIIFFILYLFGIYRIIFGKKFKFQRWYFIIAFVSLLLSIMLFITYSWCMNNGYDLLTGIDPYIEKINNSLSNYYSAKTISLFGSSSIYSGGALFMWILSNIPNQNAGLIIGLVFLFICLSIVIPFIVIEIKSFLLKKNELQSAIEKVESRKEEVIVTREENKEKEIVIDTSLPENNFSSYLIEEEPAEIKKGFEVENEYIDDYAEFERIGLSSTRKINNPNNLNDQSEFSRIELRSSKKSQINSTPIQVSEPIFEDKDDNPVVSNDVYEQPVFDTPIEVEKTFINEEINITNDNESNVECETSAIEDNNPIATNDSLIKVESPIKVESVNNVSPSLAEIKPLEPIKKVRVNWLPPSSELLTTYEISEAVDANNALALQRVEMLNKIFTDYNLGATCEGFTIGPAVTRFNINYALNASSKNVERAVDDISRRLGGVSARFTRIVENTPYSGLEVPNARITTVGFKEVFDQLPDVKKHPLAVAFGKNIAGEVISADFNDFPHLLVAGTTGSGKSIYINSIISSLIMRVSPDDLKIVLVDPKRVELTKYSGIPHLLCPVICEAVEAKNMLNKIVDEMNDRYKLFGQLPEVSEIKQYNEWAKQNGKDTLPYIVIIIDEYADLIETCKEISMPVVSIVQKSRACGIHILISTQRPSSNVITGVIKGNLPTHVALMTSSYTDSNVIIGEAGAEKLLGKGDMLVQSPLISRTGVVRLQGCFISNKEISRIVGYLKEHYDTNYDPNYTDLTDKEVEDDSSDYRSSSSASDKDDRYESIKEWIMSNHEYVSMSKLVRECSIGFSRAGKIVYALQNEGIIAKEPESATKGYKVLKSTKFGSSDNYDPSDYIG